MKDPAIKNPVMKYLALLLVLSGCTLTYTPLVREARAPEPRLVIRSGALVLDEASLELKLRLSVPEADWLAVQWFGPGNDEVSATSVWLEPAPEPQPLAVALPPGVALEDGLWRAVVSYQGQLVRQFSLQVRTPQGG